VVLSVNRVNLVDSAREKNTARAVVGICRIRVNRGRYQLGFYPFDTTVGQFISAVAEEGAVVPERFGCCHGSDQARGVIASFVRRAFGRTSLRGIARIRKAALAAILGGATRAGSFADGDMAGAENARDAPGGHVHGGAPP